MFDVLSVIREANAFWNRPAQTDLDSDDLLAVVNRKINRLFLLMQMTDKNYLAKISRPFAFRSCNQLQKLSLDDLSVVVRVESRSYGADTWDEETICDYGAWNDVVDRNLNAVAFVGTAPDNLTMAVNRDPSGLEFRILYETGGLSITNFADSVPVLQDLFKSTVFYGVAAEAGMMIDNLEGAKENSRDKKVAYLIDQENRALKDFEKWLNTEKGQSVVYRERFDEGRLGGAEPRMTWGGYYAPPVY